MRLLRIAQKVESSSELLLWGGDFQYYIIEVTTSPPSKRIRGGFFNQGMAEAMFSVISSTEGYNSLITTPLVKRMFQRRYG